MSLALYNLIRSLSKSEKRYFKLNISFHKSDKSHLKLFDAIDKQTRKGQGQYDEAKIKKQFSEEAFVKQLAVAKNRLYQQILKSLRSFYANKGSGGKIREMLDFSEVLVCRGQKEEAIIMLKRAKVLALKVENYPLVLEINKLLRTWVDPEYALQLLEEDDRNIETTKKISEYIRIYTGIGKMLKKHSRTRSKVEEIKYTAVLQHPLMKNEDYAISIEEKYYYFVIHALIYFIKQDGKKSQFFCKKTIKLIELHPLLIEEVQWQHRYATTLSNYIGVCNDPPLPVEAQESIYKLFKISSVTKQLLTLAVSNFLGVCIKTKNLVPAFLFLKENEELLLQVESDVSNIHLPRYYLNLTSLYFLAGDFKKAHKYVHKILHEIPFNDKEDVHCMARIINLVVLYELVETDLLENNIRSTYRFLYKRNRIYKFEEAILLFIRKELPNVKNERYLKEAFGKIAKKLRKLAKDPYEKKALDYFNFIGWIESKIENRPMR